MAMVEIKIITAGMVHGTPDWQLDRMVESEAAAAWEDQQVKEVPKPLDSFSFDQKNEAHSSLTVVDLDFSSIKKYLAEACDAIPGTPEADKMASIYDAVSDLYAEMIEIKETIHKSMHGM